MQASTANESAPRFTPPPAAPDLRRDFLNLAEPLIADRITDAYDGLFEDAERRRAWCVQHRRLWRAILLEHRTMMTSVSRELRDELDAAGVPADFAEAVDQSVLEELLDVTLRCFRTSNDKTQRCSRILLEAATFIGAARGRAVQGH